MSKMTDDIIAAMTPAQRARYGDVEKRGAIRLARAIDLQRPEQGEPPAKDTEARAWPTKFEHQPPPVPKRPPTPVYGVTSGYYSNTPKPREQGPPAEAIPQTTTPPKPANVMVEAFRQRANDDKLAPAPRLTIAAGAPNMAEAMRQSMSKTQRAEFDRRMVHADERRLKPGGSHKP